MLIGYARVSKADGSQLLDLQLDALMGAGIAADRIYEDRVSSRKDHRPGLEACLKALQHGAPPKHAASPSAARPNCARTSAPSLELSLKKENPSATSPGPSMSMSQRSIAVSTTRRPYDSTSFRSHARSKTWNACSRAADEVSRRSSRLERQLARLSNHLKPRE